MSSSSLQNLFSSPETTNSKNNVTEQTQLLRIVSSNKNHAWFIRHDSEFSVNSNYQAEDIATGNSNNESSLLNTWQGAVLLTAECLGTGLLALPGNIHTLGSAWGFFFLLLQLPINYYAGTILHMTALQVEQQHELENQWYRESLQQGKIKVNHHRNSNNNTDHRTNIIMETKDEQRRLASSQQQVDDVDYREMNQNTASSILSYLSCQQPQPHKDNDDSDEWIDLIPPTITLAGEKLHHDTATHDFIGFTQALFDNKIATRIVRTIYYCNIFLVLGNYVLVMSHAVQAVFVELCLPKAGVWACLCMFGVSQLRTMARLGRTASIFSLLALMVVVVQCLVAVHSLEAPVSTENSGIMDVSNPTTTTTTTSQLLRKFSAIGSIGFAVGSQKLFLNIRHELADRKKAPQSLALSLSTFGTFYVVLVLLAGHNPPSFLLDAIPVGTRSKRVAGLLLYAHIVVSYAINSQALCSSLDRAYWRLVERSPMIRWLIWTALISFLAYTVANAVPFFSDLVSFIGAMTSVPLTLLLPALFWRKKKGLALFGISLDWSCALTYFSLFFMFTATAGSVYSIQQDWSQHGAPFSCQLVVS